VGEPKSPFSFDESVTLIQRPELMFVYSNEDSRDSISITTADYGRLEPNIFLNDSLIDFDIRYLIIIVIACSDDRRMYHCLREEDKRRILILNCFFFKKLSKMKIRKADDFNAPLLEVLHTWTAHVNIFEYEILIIPVNEQ